jgi:hypothetical protein
MLIDRTFLLRGLVCGALLVGAACGSARRREPLSMPVDLDQRAERGRSVFMAHCHHAIRAVKQGSARRSTIRRFPRS